MLKKAEEVLWGSVGVLLSEVKKWSVSETRNT